MALSYGFFNAELTQSGQYDRVYAAEQFAEYFHLIVSNGVFPDPATQLQVVASNNPDMNVNVSDGYGWINGYFAKNEGHYPLAIQAASGTLNRVDAVVLRWVNSSRSMELAVKTGTPASSPATPALQRDTDVYEIMLATVTVAVGATSIPQSAITDKRADTSVCGWVTGAVQNIDTTNLFAQYDSAFQAWFEDIQAQLEGDVATNILNRINAVDAAKVNISDKASEEDVLNGASESKWVTPKSLSKFNRIGDVRLSNVPTPISGYALANGDRIPDSEEYNAIKQIVDPNMSRMYSYLFKFANSLGINIPDQKIAYDGTTFAVAGYLQDTSSTSYYYTYILYSTDLKNWNSVSLGTNGSLYSNTCPMIAYSPTLKRWCVIIGDRRGSGTRAQYSMYSSSITGSWNRATIISEGSIMNSVYFFGWVGNKFVAVTDYGYYSAMFVSPDGASWSKVSLQTSYVSSSYYSYEPCDVVYIDGVYYAIENFGNSNVLSLMYSTDEFASVNYVTLSNLKATSGHSSGKEYCKIIKETDGIYVFCKLGVFKTTGSLTSNPTFTRVSSSAFGKPIMDIFKYDGTYFVVDTEKVVSGKSISGLSLKLSWTQDAVIIAEHNGELYIEGIAKDLSQYIKVGYYLPTISIDDTYAYIKVK